MIGVLPTIFILMVWSNHVSVPVTFQEFTSIESCRSAATMLPGRYQSACVQK